MINYNNYLIKYKKTNIKYLIWVNLFKEIEMNKYKQPKIILILMIKERKNFLNTK